jgi:hypothetical protein
MRVARMKLSAPDLTFPMRSASAKPLRAVAMHRQPEQTMIGNLSVLQS